MSSEFSHLLTLDVPQKLELIGALWQSIECHERDFPASDELIAELDRRKAASERNPESLVRWETIQQQLGLPGGR
jgi:putative addiction module component (TIGR02574 family)